MVIQTGNVVFWPIVLLVGNEDARDVELVFSRTVQGAVVADRRLFDRGWCAHAVQGVQRDGGSEDSGGNDEFIQGGQDLQGASVGWG